MFQALGSGAEKDPENPTQVELRVLIGRRNKQNQDNLR